MTDESQKIFSPKRWCRFALLERPLTNALQKYCRFVGRHPIPFIIAPLLITCILSSGILLKFEIVRGLHYLYAPLHAQWKFEDRVFQESWANNDEQFYPGKDVFRRKSIYLIAVAKDGGSILRKPHTDEFINLLDWIINETFITVDGLIYTYRNICLHYRNQCFENTLARFVADIYRRSDQDQFNLTFPLFKSQLSTELTDLSQTLGGVHLDSKQRIETAKAWMILYQLQQNTKLSRKLSFHNTAVGIDDTFLILSAWHDTNSYQSTDERVGLSMQHAAVSIAITSITDIIAFLVGAIAPLPAVSLNF
uniref:SSD domain-containing protein n=1 Tax=Setaria digitata TaxID=48799 RepID=A0A915Q420_9BILA